ncbi:MAG: NAD(P)-binding domain-containing protein, partial [Halobacteriales archaeon]|nr:NAD(P)-binding domain-containing protein [Halobacteriales archaeon]
MSSHTTDDRIGVVGIGTIGFPLARNLVDSGYDVTAFDVREEPLSAFVEAGGERAETAREVGETCRS